MGYAQNINGFLFQLHHQINCIPKNQHKLHTIIEIKTLFHQLSNC